MHEASTLGGGESAGGGEPTNYEAVLRMLRTAEEKRQRAQTRADELVAERDEASASAELQIQELNLANLELRKKVRSAAAAAAGRASTAARTHAHAPSSPSTSGLISTCRV